MSSIREAKYLNRFRPGDINQILTDKGFNSSLFGFLANDSNRMARFSAATILREIPRRYTGSRYYRRQVERVDHIASQFRNVNRSREFTYFGYPEENAEIDAAIKLSDDRKGIRAKAGNGATPIFQNLVPGLSFRELSRVPVLILGAGPAGILATRVMISLGFRDIAIIDKHGRRNGIWNQPNVAGLSKNNPFRIQFRPNGYPEISVTAAPGPGASIARFLDRVSANYDTRLIPVLKREVIGVSPGDLHHVVYAKGESGKELIHTATIVINCLGGGKPLPLDGSSHMKTSSKAGIRWQQKLTLEQAKALEGKTVGFIGLGNSTAEMMVQLERFRAQGLQIDYKVFTHHARHELLEPEASGIFRNPRENLTRLAGDLPDIRAAYWSAMAKHRIQPSTRRWEYNKERKVLTFWSEQIQSAALPIDQLYVLVGYGNDPHFLNDCGMLVTDTYKGSIAADYDGEVQRTTYPIAGRGRVYPGYFALGAMLKSKENLNAEVIPGIMHRLYDLSFTAALRGLEGRFIQ